VSEVGVISMMALVNREFNTTVIPKGRPGLMTGAAPFYRCYLRLRSARTSF
jgi:hypothetical protein